MKILLTSIALIFTANAMRHGGSLDAVAGSLDYASGDFQLDGVPDSLDDDLPPSEPASFIEPGPNISQGSRVFARLRDGSVSPKYEYLHESQPMPIPPPSTKNSEDKDISSFSVDDLAFDNDDSIDYRSVNTESLLNSPDLRPSDRDTVFPMEEFLLSPRSQITCRIQWLDVLSKCPKSMFSHSKNVAYNFGQNVDESFQQYFDDLHLRVEDIVTVPTECLMALQKWADMSPGLSSIWLHYVAEFKYGPDSGHDDRMYHSFMDRVQYLETNKQLACSAATYDWLTMKYKKRTSHVGGQIMASAVPKGFGYMSTKHVDMRHPQDKAGRIWILPVKKFLDFDTSFSLPVDVYISEYDSSLNLYVPYSPIRIQNQKLKTWCSSSDRHALACSRMRLVFNQYTWSHGMSFIASSISAVSQGTSDAQVAMAFDEPYFGYIETQVSVLCNFLDQATENRIVIDGDRIVDCHSSSAYEDGGYESDDSSVNGLTVHLTLLKAVDSE